MLDNLRMPSSPSDGYYDDACPVEPGGKDLFEDDLVVAALDEQKYSSVGQEFAPIETNVAG